MNIERQKCTRCKMNLTLDKFKMKRDDTYQKQCMECNAKRRIPLDQKQLIHKHEKSKKLSMTIDGKKILQRYAECGLETAMKIMEDKKEEMITTHTET